MIIAHAPMAAILLVFPLYFLGTGSAAGQTDFNSTDERASVLELIAARFESNFSSIRTWTATYELSITSPFAIRRPVGTSGPLAVDQVFTRTQYLEVTIDLNNTTEQVFVEANEDPNRVRFVDKTGNVATLPADYHYVPQHEKFLIRDGYRYGIDLQFPRGPLVAFRNDPFAGHPDKTSLVIDQTGYVEFGRLDPRNFFRATGRREYAYESLRFAASVFHGQYGAEESNYFARHCKLSELKADDGRTVIVVTTQFRPKKAGATIGDEAVERYDLQSGLPLEYTFRSSDTGKVCSIRAWEYADDGKVAIPSKFRHISHHPKTGELQEHLEWLLLKSTVNSEFDDTKLALSRLVTENGIRLANHIDRSIQTWSAGDKRFGVATSGGAGSPSPTNQAENNWSFVRTILIGALCIVLVSGIVGYRVFCMCRSAK